MIAAFGGVGDLAALAGVAIVTAMADLLTSGNALDELRPFVPLALAFLGDGEATGYGAVKQQLKDLVERDPMDALIAAVVGGGFAYYLAERDSNDLPAPLSCSQLIRTPGPRCSHSGRSSRCRSRPCAGLAACSGAAA